jgi:hypothetical protein
LANDPAKAGVLMVGGWDSNAVDDFVPKYEIWLFRDQIWSPVASPVGPKIAGPSAISFSGGALVVGSGGSSTEETWLLSASGWKQLHPPHSPPSRFNASLAIDPASHNVMMYGGWTFPRKVFTDTWRWDGGDWQLLDSSLKSAGSPVIGSLVADAKSLLLFAYDGGVRQVAVWRWEKNQWAQVVASGSPPRIQDFGIAFDGRDILVFGGLDADQHIGDFSTAEWTWNGGKWKKIH